MFTSKANAGDVIIQQGKRYLIITRRRGDPEITKVLFLNSWFNLVLLKSCNETTAVL